MPVGRFFFGIMLIQKNMLQLKVEWEIRDTYQNEINQVGYEQWLNAFQTSDEWQKRVSSSMIVLKKFSI